MGIDLTPLFRLGAAAGKVVPDVPARLIADGIGGLISVPPGERKRLVGLHQQRAAAQPLTERQVAEATRDTFRSCARYWADAFRLPSMSTAQVAAGFSAEGIEQIERSLADGIGPILALPHLGGWEWAAAYLTRVRKWPVAAVVERLDSPELFEWFVQFRESLGIRVIPLDERALGACSKAVANGEVLCLLCDRDIGGSGIPVEFFGEETTLPPGPAAISIRSGAPLLPTVAYYDGYRVRGLVTQAIDTERQGRLRDDVARVTQSLALRLEELIRIAPTQWHLMQPNWPSDHKVDEPS